MSFMDKLDFIFSPESIAEDKLDLKFKGSTPASHQQDLCASCSFRVFIEGANGSRENYKGCTRIGPERGAVSVPEIVVNCSLYCNGAVPTLYDMKQIAWELKTSNDKKQIGFMPPKKKNVDPEDRFEDVADE